MRHDDRSPPPEVLAAIAAAYRILAAGGAVVPQPETPHWRLADRLPLDDVRVARAVARSTSRWNAAGRLDD